VIPELSRSIFATWKLIGKVPAGSLQWKSTLLRCMSAVVSQLMV
jgi:hypothetical protein